MTDKELRERAKKLLKALVTEYLFVNVPNLVERQAANAIFRELVAVRDQDVFTLGMPCKPYKGGSP